MIRAGIAKRYAEAVFGIARAEGTFDRWLADLEAMAGVQARPEIARLVAAPAIGMSAKERVLAEYLSGVSPKASNLVRLLLHKGRFAIAPGIAEHFRAMVNEHRGIATAEVASAVPLNGAELEAVAHRLSAMTGRKVQIVAVVDPSLIGGVVARIGDQLIDGSVRGRLEALKKRLSST